MQNKEENIFKIPEGYFNELEQSILDKTINVPQASKLQLSSSVKQFMAAASVLLIVSASIYFSKNYIAKNEAIREQEEKEILNNIYNKNELEQEIAIIDDSKIFYFNQ